MRTLTICLCLAATPATAATLYVNDKVIDHRPSPRIQADSAFISPEIFAAAVGLEAKMIAPGKLMILCDDVSCLPVHLAPADVMAVKSTILVNARPLAVATGHQLTITEGTIRLTRSSPGRSEVDWALPVGAMLPDIVLRDLENREVHLADFLGKRVLICTWASW